MLRSVVLVIACAGRRHLLMSGDSDERFAFGLKLMINGLLHTEPPGA